MNRIEKQHLNYSTNTKPTTGNHIHDSYHILHLVSLLENGNNGNNDECGCKEW